MTAQDFGTLFDRFAAYKQQEQPCVAGIHNLVCDILDTRGLHLHHATSDRLPKYKKAELVEADRLDDLLIDTLVLLPHNIPGYQIVIKNPITGIDLYYQRYENGHPVYVRFADWQPDEMIDQVIDRRAMLLNERSRSQAALEEIQDYEARGLSGVTEQAANRIENVDDDLLAVDGSIKASGEPLDPFKE